jgi:hypothetical protein
VLATLHRWRSALPSTGGRLRVDSTSTVTLDANAEDLDECLRRATRALAIACNLPTEDKEGGISTYKAFIRKLLTRPLNLKRGTSSRSTTTRSLSRHPTPMVLSFWMALLAHIDVYSVLSHMSRIFTSQRRQRRDAYTDLTECCTSINCMDRLPGGQRNRL